MHRLLLVVAILFAFGGCQTDDGPPLVASDMTLYLPLPGSSAAVAYFVLQNNSRTVINIDSIRSPQFAAVQLHETTIADGVSRMRALEKLQIPAGEKVVFEAGGKHAMLMQPRKDIDAGSLIDLTIRYDDGALMTISTSALSRPTGE